MAEATHTVTINLGEAGFDPERHPLVIAVGKNGRASKLWWKGEPLETVIAVHIDGRSMPSRIFFDERFKGRLAGDALAAHQRKVIREMNAAGFEIFVETEEGKKR